MSALVGRVAIITGAAQGIGRAYAERFAREGARVVATDLGDCAETVAAIAASGGEAIGIGADITSSGEPERIVRTALERYGQVDILLNNAAFYGGITLAPFDEIEERHWDRAMAVNVKGVWLMCRAVAPTMRDRAYGRIINVASNVIFMGKPNFIHYVASKGAVWALTNALSREFAGTGVTVNCLAPGYTITPATREMGSAEEVAQLEREILDAQSVKRLVEPNDLVGPALFLASEESAQVTGQTLTVDGGVIVG